MQLSQRVAHERLARICFIDYDREMALVAERHEPGRDPDILGVGRLSKIAGGNTEAEFAILVSDSFQGQGLGTELLRRIIQWGRDEGLALITGYISPENDAMQRIARKLGFTLKRDPGDGVIEARLELSKP
jgi:acetyltransferase